MSSVVYAVGNLAVEPQKYKYNWNDYNNVATCNYTSNMDTCRVKGKF